SYNRGMYTFNDTVDRALLKPIASGYDALTPQPVQTCIHNIFNNVADVWSAANSFLQGRGHDFERVRRPAEASCTRPRPETRPRP
ncbi:MAG: MlaA family lipoprotein, partial [Pollutimonas bauzanensis]